MADEGDFYEVLGIVRGCKETEVRRVVDAKIMIVRVTRTEGVMS
jgi:hypothetical protein